MKHLLNEEQTKNFHAHMMELFEEFKVNNSWGLTEQMEDNYLTGIIDFCDALIFANDALTFDISTLRNEVQENLENVEDEDEESSE